MTVDTLAWNLAGVQPVKVLWQVMQLAAVGMCDPPLPVAVAPLWQLAQLVTDVNVLWSTFAPLQVVVLWHEPQLAVVAT